MSFSNSCCSIFVTIYSSACSISWAKSCSYDCSPCLLGVSYSNESTTFMGAVSSVCTCYAPCCSCSCCISFSYPCNSCSFRSFSFNSCNSFTVSSILCFSLCLYAVLLSHCCLFTSIAKAAFCTSGPALNLQLCFAFALLTIFLLPFSHTGMFASVDATDLLDASSCYFTNHSTMMPINLLDLEKLQQYIHESSST